MHRLILTRYEKRIQCQIRSRALPAVTHKQPYGIDEEVSSKSIRMLKFCAQTFEWHHAQFYCYKRYVHYIVHTRVRLRDTQFIYRLSQWNEPML